MGSSQRANILILSAQVPFTRGGAELLCETLVFELRKRDYTVDTVALPFSAQPIESLLKQVALWRALDLSQFAGRRVDLVIGTKFPTYAVQHPKKSVWLVHQHRQLYDLYGSRFGDFSTSTEHEALRRMLMRADSQALAECQKICTISPNVTSRLQRYSDRDSTVLTPPLPYGRQYYSAEKQPYVLSVGRLCSIKRTDLIVKAMATIPPSMRLKIVGLADEPEYDSYLQSEIRKHGIGHRVDFLGRVGQTELLQLFAQAFAVCYAPFDEDYGFVTLEALASNTPVITARDSGGVLSFIEHEVNGLIVEPTEAGIAEACIRLMESPELYAALCASSRNAPGVQAVFNTTWDHVIEELTSPLSNSSVTTAAAETDHASHTPRRALNL